MSRLWNLGMVMFFRNVFLVDVSEDHGIYRFELSPSLLRADAGTLYDGDAYCAPCKGNPTLILINGMTLRSDIIV
jgi:hypothetical protein